MITPRRTPSALGRRRGRLLCLLATTLASAGALLSVVATAEGASALPASTTATAAPAQVGELPEWAVEPAGPAGETTSGRAAFIYSLAPGQAIEDTVAVSNLGDEPLVFRVYATDAFNTLDGGFALLTGDQEPIDLGAWVQLASTEVTVEPGQRADVPFRINVPPDATPGDHVGGIVASRTLTGGASQDGVDLDLDQRVGARIYLRVSGELQPALSIEAVRTDYSAPSHPFGVGRPLTTTYQVRNVGNVRLAPATTAEVSGPFGRGSRAAQRVEIPELLPGGSYEVSFTFDDVQPLGRMSVRLEATAEGAGVTRTASVWAVPLLFVFFVVAVVGFFVGRRALRNRKRFAAQDAELAAAGVEI